MKMKSMTELEQQKQRLKKLIKEYLMLEAAALGAGMVVGPGTGAWAWRLSGAKGDLKTFDPENPKFKKKSDKK